MIYGKVILSLLAMSLLTNCSLNVYTSDGCVLFPEIVATDEDKAILKESGVSYGFALGIANHNEIHKKICNKQKLFEIWK